MEARRVVTGHDDRGRSIIVADERVKGISISALPGIEFHRVWGADGTLTFPGSGAMPAALSYFPPVGGFRFGFFTLPPAAPGEPPPQRDMPAVLAEFEAKLPGLAQYMEPDSPGMHTTPTVDIDVVISGEIVMELDEGKTVTLRAGDSVVQNGTRHRWRNEGSVPATIAFFICGADHQKF